MPSHSQEVALNRSITEAVQGRTCFIAGARDDMIKSRYRMRPINKLFSEINFLEEELILTSFNISINNCLSDLRERLARLGWSLPYYYQFKNTEPFTVVKVVLPDALPISFSDMTFTHHRFNKFLDAPRGDTELIMKKLFA